MSLEHASCLISILQLISPPALISCWSNARHSIEGADQAALGVEGEKAEGGDEAGVSRAWQHPEFCFLGHPSPIFLLPAVSHPGTVPGTGAVHVLGAPRAFWCQVCGHLSGFCLCSCKVPDNWMSRSSCSWNWPLTSSRFSLWVLFSPLHSAVLSSCLTDMVVHSGHALASVPQPRVTRGPACGVRTRGPA